jgi:hypothetical protein
MKYMVTNENVKQIVRDLLKERQFDQLASLDVSRVTDMSELFYYTYIDEVVNLNAWDTSNVTNMSDMFGNCRHHVPLIGEWDTSKVTTMNGMFAGHEDHHGRVMNVYMDQHLGKWNTKNVTDMNGMFAFCMFQVFHVESCGIGQWNTKKVTDMRYMFLESNFREDLSEWDTSNVSEMDGMFDGDFPEEFKPLDVVENRLVSQFTRDMQDPKRALFRALPMNCQRFVKERRSEKITRTFNTGSATLSRMPSEVGHHITSFEDGMNVHDKQLIAQFTRDLQDPTQVLFRRLPRKCQQFIRNQNKRSQRKEEIVRTFNTGSATLPRMPPEVSRRINAFEQGGSRKRRRSKRR